MAAKKRRIVGPEDVWLATLQVPGDEEEYGVFMDEAKKLWEKHRHAGQMARFDVPLFAAPTLLYYMRKMIRIDPGLKFRRIVERNGNLFVSVSTIPTFTIEIDDLKLDLYRKIDDLLMLRVIAQERKNVV